MNYFKLDWNIIIGATLVPICGFLFGLALRVQALETKVDHLVSNLDKLDAIAERLDRSVSALEERTKDVRID